MSYLFSANNDRIDGALQTSLDFPLTFGCFAYFSTSWATANVTLWSAGPAPPVRADEYDAIALREASTAGRIQAWAIEAAIADNEAISVDGASTNVWTPIVVVFSKGTANQVDNVKIYRSAIGTMGDGGVCSISMSGNISHFRIGEELNASRDWFSGATQNRFFAEFAIWRKELSTQEITDYLDGKRASGIAATDLVAYFPLQSDATQAAGIQTFSLTVSGATQDAQHPTITDAGALVLPTYDACFRQNTLLRM